MTQHTQKQWLEISKMQKNGWTIEVRSSDGVLIHSAPKTSMSIKTKKANAKLIAHAPDLLRMLESSSQVLKLLMDEKADLVLQHHSELLRLQVDIKLTILKATGEL
jgi:hypothetical protein